MRAVNLIPADQRSGASVGAGRSEGAAYAVLAMLVVIAALALLYGKANRDVASSKSKAATLTAEAQRAESQASALAPYTSFVSLRQQRQQAVEALVDTRFDWAHAIHEFGRVLSSEVSISVPTFQISGCATSQHAVADTMQRLRLIDGVSEVTLQSSTKGNAGSGATAAAGSGAACTPNAAVFQMTVTFQALPAASTSAAAATASNSNVSDPAGASGGKSE
jgi:Tfp pilus assembly protein PilN